MNCDLNPILITLNSIVQYLVIKKENSDDVNGYGLERISATILGVGLSNGYNIHYQTRDITSMAMKRLSADKSDIIFVG